MHTMKIWQDHDRLLKTLLLLAALLLLGVLSSGFNGETGSGTGQLLNLPRGDPEAGRKAFVDLKCHACHPVAGDNEMSKPISTVEGPTLGLKQARYRAYYIADSIIFPSHAISLGFKPGMSGTPVSPMGDFSDSMTVKQLADLVAYVKQLDEEV